MLETKLRSNAKGFTMLKLSWPQQVLELKADLEKAKKDARTADEVEKVAKQASYDLGVREMGIRLAEELAEICRDYCKEVWAEALNQAGVPAASEWRNAENIFYPADIREVPATLPPPSAFALTFSKQPFTTQAFLPPLDITKGPSKASDQSQRVEVAKGKRAGQDGPWPEDKGKDKEVKPLLKAKGT